MDRSAEEGPNAGDAALLDRIARREPAALRDAYDRHAPAIHAICLRLLRDRGDAEQVLLDVFADLWERPHRYDATRGSLACFLAIRARSRSLDAARARTRAARRAGEVARSAAVDAPAPEAASARSLRDEARAAVAGALDGLPPEQRDAVRLAFFDGLSHTEIAEQLERPLGTVKTQVRQGLLKMRNALRGYWEGGRARS